MTVDIAIFVVYDTQNGDTMIVVADGFYEYILSRGFVCKSSNDPGQVLWEYHLWSHKSDAYFQFTAGKYAGSIAKLGRYGMHIDGHSRQLRRLKPSHMKFLPNYNGSTTLVATITPHLHVDMNNARLEIGDEVLFAIKHRIVFGKIVSSDPIRNTFKVVTATSTYNYYARHLMKAQIDFEKNRRDVTDGMLTQC